MATIAAIPRQHLIPLPKSGEEIAEYLHVELGLPQDLVQKRRQTPPSVRANPVVIDPKIATLVLPELKEGLIKQSPGGKNLEQNLIAQLAKANVPPADRREMARRIILKAAGLGDNEARSLTTNQAIALVESWQSPLAVYAEIEGTVLSRKAPREALARLKSWAQLVDLGPDDKPISQAQTLDEAVLILQRIGKLRGGLSYLATHASEPMRHFYQDRLQALYPEQKPYVANAQDEDAFGYDSEFGAIPGADEAAYWASLEDGEQSNDLLGVFVGLGDIKVALADINDNTILDRHDTMVLRVGDTLTTLPVGSLRADRLRLANAFEKALVYMLDKDLGSRFKFSDDAMQFNSAVFKMIDSNTAVLAAGVSPSEAVKDMMYGDGALYSVDCATALMMGWHIAQYILYIETYGSVEKAERYFDQDFAGMEIGPWHSGPQLGAYMVDIDPAFDEPTAGQWRYYDVEDLSFSSLLGGWQGENVVPIQAQIRTTGERVFFGHPFGLVGERELVATLSNHRSPLTTKANAFSRHERFVQGLAQARQRQVDLKETAGTQDLAFLAYVDDALACYDNIREDLSRYQVLRNDINLQVKADSENRRDDLDALTQGWDPEAWERRRQVEAAISTRDQDLSKIGERIVHAIDLRIATLDRLLKDPMHQARHGLYRQEARVLRDLKAREPVLFDKGRTVRSKAFRARIAGN